MKAALLQPGNGADDDSQGKNKHFLNRQRFWGFLMTFVIGMCAGIITSERVYLSLNAPEPLRGDTRVGAGEVDVGIPAKIERRGAAQVGYGQRAGRKVGEPRSPLEKYLIQIAPEGDVLVAISDMNLVRWGNMLGTWVECVQHVGISNYMVIAIDRELEQHLRERDVNVFLMERSVAAAQQGTGSNHAVSALKFGILQQLLALGWNVLLSDVDVVTLRNPFDFLHRDRDIEGMTDGFDDATAYGAIEGFDDPSMGWARYAQKHTMFALNSGLFFVMANERTVQLMGNLEARLRKAKYWDQTAFNEEVFFSPRDGESKPAITVRVMDIMKFTNSKVLFKRIRNMPPESRPTPVMVHINYHPDKHERMKAVIAAYVHGKPADLMRFPGGSEAGSR